MRSKEAYSVSCRRADVVLHLLPLAISELACRVPPKVTGWPARLIQGQADLPLPC